MLEQETAGKQPGEIGTVIGGIDGATPLGFMAALGLLRVLSDRDSHDRAPAALSWKQRDAWRPVLHGPTTLDEVIDAVVDDVAAWASAPLLGFRYVKVEKSGPKAVGGLRAPAAVLRAFLVERRDRHDEGTLNYAASLMSEEVTEDIKEAASVAQHEQFEVPISCDVSLDRSVDRTFFDFTARNAQFLEQVEHLRAHLSREGISHALERGVFDPTAPRSLDWDPTADTPGAIYTGYARGFLPVHEWLAFRGLTFLPLAARGTKVRNTGCSGRRLDGEFTWPLWARPIGVGALRSLVGYPAVGSLSVEQRRALGLTAVFRASLTKKADGRSGMFSPSRPV